MGQLFCLNGMVYGSSTTEKAACEILPFSLEDKTSYAVVKSAHSMQVPGAIKNIEKIRTGSWFGLGTNLT